MQQRYKAVEVLILGCRDGITGDSYTALFSLVSELCAGACSRVATEFAGYVGGYALLRWSETYAKA